MYDTLFGPDPSGDTFVRVFDAQGNALGGPVQINPTNAAATFVTGIQTGMVALPDGGFEALWDQSVTTANGAQDQIFGQRFDANGVAVGGPQELFTTASDPTNLSETSLIDEFKTAFANGTLLTGAVTQDSGTTAGNVAFGPDHSLTLDFVYTAIGAENTSIALINAAVTDTSTSTTTGGLETLTLTISGFPPGSVFLANGAQVGAFDSVQNTWVISDPAQIATLATHPLSVETPKDYHGTFTLHVDAQVIDSAVLSTGLASSTPLDVIKTYDVTVTDINDVTLTNPSKVAVAAGVGAVSLGIAAPVDADGGNDLTIVLSTLPQYGTVQYFNGTGFVTAHVGDVLTSDELASLQFLPPANGSFHGDSLVYSVFDGPSPVNGAVAMSVPTCSPSTATTISRRSRCATTPRRSTAAMPARTAAMSLSPAAFISSPLTRRCQARPARLCSSLAPTTSRRRCSTAMVTSSAGRSSSTPISPSLTAACTSSAWARPASTCSRSTPTAR
jgi:hypothetical protein